MKQILNKLFDYNTLSEEQAMTLFRGIVKGAYNDVQIASLMTVFLMRNISLEELSGFRTALLEYATPLDLGTHDYLDIVGTGGDGKDTFNISTCAAFVVAAAGYRVVKHGNYGATSICGASNLIEHYGVRFGAEAEQYRCSLEECNIAYLHAPVFNTAMRRVAPVRRDLGVRNFFNMLGPMINPAAPRYQLLGTYNLALQRLYCYMFQRLGVTFAVVHSLDGYDEISLTSPFKVVTPTLERIYTPEELGYATAAQASLFGGGCVAESAAIFGRILDGEATAAQRDCVVANAAFAIQLMEPSLTLQEAIIKARMALDHGTARRCFDRFRAVNG